MEPKGPRKYATESTSVFYVCDVTLNFNIRQPNIVWATKVHGDS